LRVEPKAPLRDTTLYGPVSSLEATATLDEGRGALTVFAINRDRGEALKLTGDLRGFPDYRVEEHLVLIGEDAGVPNAAGSTARMRLHSAPGAEVREGRLRVVLPSLSWNVVHLSREAEIA
jgi:alpha-L-arabinofuranosidase